MPNKLALLGGAPITTKSFSEYNTIDDNEINEVLEVLKTGHLSCFIANAGEYFEGGPKIKQLEKDWTEYFGVKHAIAMNSATSGLFAAVSACGIGPGDEVIVSPLTMSATGTAILANNAIPIFADVDPRTSNISPKSIKEKISKRTKAIFVVHLTGHPADMDPIMQIAKEYGLSVLGDNAQSPGAFYKNKYCGTIEDIGVFSLNCHKTIQSGEGGIAVTNDDELAFRLKLVRNHGEKCVAGFGRTDLNLLGFNLRMTEMEAAVAIHQLKKLKKLTKHKQDLAHYLSMQLKKNFNFLSPPYTQEDCTHAYYIYPIVYDFKKVGIPVDIFAKAIQAEGIPMYARYGNPIYQLPIYQNLSAFGNTGHPFKTTCNDTSLSYSGTICPIAENIQDSSLFLYEMIRWPQTQEDMDLIIQGIEKVYNNRKLLINYEK